jgi:hypothetical protein
MSARVIPAVAARLFSSQSGEGVEETRALLDEWLSNSAAK